MKDAIKYTIAVVDDDYRVLESLESLLESAGHAVRLFPSAEAFLNAGCLAEADCLISDIRMPGMDGFRLLQLAKLDRPGLPVILITGRDEMKAQVTTDLSCSHFFMKPFDGKKLLTVVTTALQESR